MQRQRETGRQRYYRQIREIKDELGVSHDEARLRWSEYYAPGGVPIKPVKYSEPVDVTLSEPLNVVCPFCRDDLYQADDYRVCSGCAAIYHDECLLIEMRGRCGTLGCGTRVHSASVTTQPTRPTIVISPTDVAPSGLRILSVVTQHPVLLAILVVLIATIAAVAAFAA